MGAETKLQDSIATTMDAMGIAARDAQGSIRISLGRGTEGADIHVMIPALQTTIERLRAISSIEGTVTSPAESREAKKSSPDGFCPQQTP